MKRTRRWIRFDPTAIVALVYLLVIERSVWAVLALTAAALHEVGHFAAALWLGLPPSEITLGAMGAQMTFTAQILSYRDEAMIAAAGPTVNLVCAAGSLLWLHWELPLAAPCAACAEHLLFFAAASLALAFINLIPLRSFDGGRLFGCLFAFWFGDAVSERLISVTTVFCSLMLWSAAIALWFSPLQNLSLLVLSVLLIWRMICRSDAERHQTHP